jgi:Arc/MetJ-type ribon-helix-helix transcriptional regulator
MGNGSGWSEGRRSIMVTLTISLSEAQKAFVDVQVAAGGFASASAYIGRLIEQAERMKERDRINGLLQEGLKSKASEMTGEDWEDLRHEVREELAKEPRHARQTHPKGRSA